MVLNKNINFLRNTAGRPLTIWRHEPSSMAFLAVSDVGGTGSKYDTLDEDNLSSDNTQGAWMILTAGSWPVGNQ